MARTQVEIQLAFIIAKVEHLYLNNEDRHKSLTSHLKLASYSKSGIYKAFFTLLGNGRTYSAYKNSFGGQVTGVSKAIKGEKPWTKDGLDALGYLEKSTVDVLEHYFKSLAEVTLSLE